MSGQLFSLPQSNLFDIAETTYSLNTEWINSTGNRFFTDISAIPNLFLPDNCNHILVSAVHTYTTADAINLSDLRAYIIAPGLQRNPVASAWLTVGESTPVSGTFLTGPATYTNTTYSVFGPSASTVLTSLQITNQPHASNASQYTGQLVSGILSSNTTSTGVAPIPRIFRVAWQATAAGGNFQTSSGAVATTQMLVMGIVYNP